ncbi:unnamed protein product, partial [Aphanomyces euteiches]
MSRAPSPAREVKQEARSSAPGFDQNGQRVCFVYRKPGHKAADCKEASPNTQNKGYRKGKNAIKRFKKNKKKNGPAARRARRKARAAAMQDCQEEERWITLEDALEVPYCPDTGADQNIIPRKMVDALLKERPSLKVTDLDEPIHGTACNDMPFETKSYVELNLRLQTAAGAVTVPGRRICYIVDEGDEFLASHETLKSIGLDIDRWLEQVAKQQREADGDDLGAESDAGPM